MICETVVGFRRDEGRTNAGDGVRTQWWRCNGNGTSAAAAAGGGGASRRGKTAPSSVDTGLAADGAEDVQQRFHVGEPTMSTHRRRRRTSARQGRTQRRIIVERPDSSARPSTASPDCCVWGGGGGGLSNGPQRVDVVPTKFTYKPVFENTFFQISRKTLFNRHDKNVKSQLNWVIRTVNV